MVMFNNCQANWLKFLWTDGTDPDTNFTLISDASYHFVTSPGMMFSYGNGTVGRYTKAWKEYDHINVGSLLQGKTQPPDN